MPSTSCTPSWGSWVPSDVPRGTCKLLPGGTPLPAYLSACPQSQSEQVLLWALATEGNFSLKLDLRATQMSAFSPSVLYENMQVENMRPLSSHLVCALRSQVQERFFCCVSSLEKSRTFGSRPESEENRRPRFSRASRTQAVMCLFIFWPCSESVFWRGRDVSARVLYLEMTMVVAIGGC